MNNIKKYVKSMGDARRSQLANSLVSQNNQLNNQEEIQKNQHKQ